MMPLPSSQLLGSELRVSLLLGGMVSVRMLGLFMLLPVLIISGDHYADAKPALLGLALSIYALTQAVLQIPFGILSDKYGRKPLLAIGLLLYIAGSVLAGLSQTIGELIVARAVQGTGAIGTVALACLADNVRPHARPKANAVVGIIISISFLAGLPLGPSLVGAAGIETVFFLTATLGVLALLALLMLPKEHRHTNTRISFPALRHKTLRVLYIGAFFLHMIVASCFVWLPVVLRDLLAIDLHWRFYLVVLLASFAPIFACLGRIQKGGRFKSALIAAITLYGFSVSLLPFVADSLALVGLVMILFFFSFNLLEALLPSRVAALCSAHNKGAAMGLFSTGQFLGAFCGGALSGWSIGLWSGYWISILALCILGVWVFMVATTRSTADAQT